VKYLKQPQNSPLSVAQQVALIFTGINGFLDDLPVTSVKKYCASLLSYIESSKKQYTEIVSSTNQFTDEAESLLKEAIAESKALFVKN
jgi:F-type H+-transporting ATPase subunit alpha